MNTKFMAGAITALGVGIALSTPAHAQDMSVKVQPRTRTQNTQTITRHKRNRFPARYVTLNLRNAPVRTALMQLFQKAGRDYSLTNSVDGVVNMQITNKPFDEALRMIANNSTRPLTYSVDSGVYFIQPRAIPVARAPRTVVARQQEEPPSDNRYLPTDPGQLSAAMSPNLPNIGYTSGVPAVTLWGFGGPGYPVNQGFGYPDYGNNFYGNYGGQTSFYYPGNGFTVPPTTVTPPVVGNGGSNIILP